MDTFPVNEHGLILRRTALDAGASDRQLTRAVDAGTLVRVWPGAYVLPDKSRTPEVKHRLKAVAATLLSESDVPLSHQSAGVLHGMSLLFPDLSRVHLTTGHKTGGRIETQRHLHSGRLGPDDVTAIDGITVTSLEVTAVDIACSGNFFQALAVLDSALRLGADRERMSALLDSRRRGVAVARRALAFASPLADNAGESWGRGQMIVAELPVPRLQREYFDADGRFVAKVDYDWEGKLVGEFDGMRKYTKDLGDDETALDVMKREKAREDGVRRLGPMVIRWVWADLRQNRMVPMVREWLERLEIGGMGSAQASESTAPANWLRYSRQYAP
ncbi:MULTISPECIES: type IV toxin-antitoxin system AbiEi family antitoxin domain-containing protein [Gordonia]|uniref:type IV toxin-antitoxin system AbiEi family antitoxin domain-containing protein n=1 Tax=Gordonia TaxID=2053 RepID=UPI0007EA8851|nr:MULTISPECIES: type IV toxin-antitoxin system AbiEi family antitoxin domain-containing protein [Gordonia]OBC10763.1 hypothetical protein A5785_21590 [Gordonia sp. 852002-50395_SCH5434458]OBC15445.1 hypothetical protein A5786_21050 [Gordonia sp. 852002-50816_SCH5313054-a]OBC17751.1 hypothetical protein A5788_11690 [Gordonia sp. 852002-50816_SCH5313054-c]